MSQNTGMRPTARALLVSGLVVSGLVALLVSGFASAAAPALGATAPAFRLQDQNGAWHQLADYRGKWVVLYFYQKDQTPTCTRHALGFKETFAAFQGAGAVLLGASVDDTASHKAFADRHALPFPLLADSSKKTAADYGVLTKLFGVMEVARRETLIIDPQGRLAKRYPDVEPEGHPAQVLADLKALMAKR